MKRSRFTKNLMAVFATFTCTALLLTNALSVALAVDEANVQEYVDTENTCYFQDPNGNIWEFDKIYELKDGEEVTTHLLEYGEGKGVICRPYTGEQAPWYVQPYNEKLYSFDTEGSFEYNGNSYDYMIMPATQITVTDKSMLYRQILGYKMTDDERIQNIQFCDFKKDGEINIADIVLLNKLYMSTPSNFCTYYNNDTMMKEVMNYEDFFAFLLYHYNKGETEIRVQFGDKVPEADPVPAPPTTIITDNISATELVAMVRQLEVKRVDLVIGK